MQHFPKKSKLKLSLHTSPHFFNYFSNYWQISQISYSARDLKHYNPTLAVNNPKKAVKIKCFRKPLSEKHGSGTKSKWSNSRWIHKAGLYTKSPAELQYHAVLSQWPPMGHLTVQLFCQPKNETRSIGEDLLEMQCKKSPVINIMKHQQFRWVS